MAEAVLQASFKFGRNYGAVLLMRKPVTSKLEGLEQVLVPGGYEHLKHKHVVSEVVTCPAYALYLSGKSAYQVYSSAHRLLMLFQ